MRDRTPAYKAGLSFVPPALVDQILDDVGTEDGRLRCFSLR
jgi:hypothetical protein